MILRLLMSDNLKEDLLPRGRHGNLHMKLSITTSCSRFLSLSSSLSVGLSEYSISFVFIYFKMSSYLSCCLFCLSVCLSLFL